MSHLKIMVEFFRFKRKYVYIFQAKK